MLTNLNDAFNKNSDFEFANNKKTNNEEKIASFLHNNSNESVIKSSHLTNINISNFETQSISPIRTTTKLLLTNSGGGDDESLSVYKEVEKLIIHHIY